MYLTDMMTKSDKETRVNYILSTVLKIKDKKVDNIEKNAKDEKETIKFLSEKMIKEVKRVFE